MEVLSAERIREDPIGRLEPSADMEMNQSHEASHLLSQPPSALI